MRPGLPAAAGLCVVGAAVVLIAGGRTWVALVVPAPPPLPDTTLRLAGGDLAPGVRALGLLGLAGAAALPAARGWGRTAVGALLCLAGAAVLALAARVLADPAAAVAASDAYASAGGGALIPAVDTGAALPACLLGGLLLAGAGLLVVLRGRRWTAMGARFDAPAARAKPATPAGQPAQEQAAPEHAAWDALDRGEDPTRPGR